LVSKTIGLDEVPRLGRMVPELNEETVRELPLYSYRILYEIKPTHIEVLAVIHKRRDVQPDEIQRVQ
jgi:plasmid stabilization system protein ParE